MVAVSYFLYLPTVQCSQQHAWGDLALPLSVPLFKFPSHKIMRSCSSALILVAKSLFNFKQNSRTLSFVCRFRRFREKCKWNCVALRLRTLITHTGLVHVRGPHIHQLPVSDKSNHNFQNEYKLLNTGIFMRSLHKFNTCRRGRVHPPTYMNVSSNRMWLH
jgi:hypothetical protein